MLSKVQKYIHSISSTAPLEALQEACQLFEKEREQWKQERLALWFTSLVMRLRSLSPLEKTLDCGVNLRFLAHDHKEADLPGW